MSRLTVGGRVQITSDIPGFHLQKGTIAEITQPFVSGDAAREEALRELRLYVVRLDDGRHFRFRGKELIPRDEKVPTSASGSNPILLKPVLPRTG